MLSSSVSTQDNLFTIFSTVPRKTLFLFEPHAEQDGLPRRVEMRSPEPLLTGLILFALSRKPLTVYSST